MASTPRTAALSRVDPLVASSPVSVPMGWRTSMTKASASFPAILNLDGSIHASPPSREEAGSFLWLPGGNRSSFASKDALCRMTSTPPNWDRKPAWEELDDLLGRPEARPSDASFASAEDSGEEGALEEAEKQRLFQAVVLRLRKRARLPSACPAARPTLNLARVHARHPPGPAVSRRCTSGGARCSSPSMRKRSPTWREALSARRPAAGAARAAAVLPAPPRASSELARARRAAAARTRQRAAAAAALPVAGPPRARRGRAALAAGARAARDDARGRRRRAAAAARAPSSTAHLFEEIPEYAGTVPTSSTASLSTARATRARRLGHGQGVRVLRPRSSCTGRGRCSARAGPGACARARARAPRARGALARACLLPRVCVCV